MYLKVEFKSPIKLTTEDIRSSLDEFSINKNECYMESVTRSINCLPKPKEKSSLLRFSDFWLESESPVVKGFNFKALNCVSLRFAARQYGNQN